MTYNMTGFTRSNNLLEMFTVVNSASSTVLASGILIIAWIFLFMILLRYNPPAESVLSSSIVCSLLSLMLLAANIIPIIWVIGFALLAAMAGVALFINK